MFLADRELENAPQAYEYEKITVDATAGGVALTGSKIQVSGARACQRVEVYIETNPIRYLFNDPAVKAVSATDGVPAAAATSFVVDGESNIRNLRMIRSGAADGTAHVVFYR